MVKKRNLVLWQGPIPLPSAQCFSKGRIKEGQVQRDGGLAYRQEFPADQPFLYTEVGEGRLQGLAPGEGTALGTGGTAAHATDLTGLLQAGLKTALSSCLGRGTLRRSALVGHAGTGKRIPTSPLSRVGV